MQHCMMQALDEKALEYIIIYLVESVQSIQLNFDKFLKYNLSYLTSYTVYNSCHWFGIFQFYDNIDGYYHSIYTARPKNRLN